ncbi:DEAD/DEAH box helicase [Desulfobacter postgatei]|uniref:DEAD/DEAH box helicase n=1 Tax=Desulfobacter postgatei TaxID=2293 RepID=UPI002FDA4F3C
MIELYPIQNKIVDQCRDAFRYHKRVVLQAATGVGKTVIATWMINEALKKGKRSLFVCDRISLINQTSDVFHTYGVEHGIIQADNPLYDPLLPVQIGSIQTLARRQQREYDMIVIDECHTWFSAHVKLLEHNPDAFVLGLSATPFTKGLGKYFDTHIEPVPVKTLIRMGYLSPFEIFGPAQFDLSGVRVVAGEYREDDLSDLVSKPKLIADVVQTWKALGQDRKTICFVVNVAHGRALEKAFNRAGVRAKEINGYMPKEDAEQIIRDFREDRIKLLLSCEMMVKGFDVPSVSCVQFATATKSPIKWIQACGRGLRTFEGKTICRILDHGTNADRLGFPDEWEFLKLDDGKNTKSKSKKKEKPEKLPVRCPSCGYYKPVGMRKCPACGLETVFVKDVEAEEGELKLLQRRAKKEYSLSEKQSFLAQLNWYAAEKGYAQGKNGCYGWAIHKYQLKFGSSAPSRIDWAKKEPVTEQVRRYIQHLNIKYAKGIKNGRLEQSSTYRQVG